MLNALGAGADAGWITGGRSVSARRRACHVDRDRGRRGHDLLYFARLEHFVAFDASLLRARWSALRRILQIGLPPGREFALFFVFLSVIFLVIRDFGADAQAGFGIGTRVMQAIFLPAMALAFAAAPLAGQNMGAGRHDRVRETFRVAAIGGSVLMALLTVLAQWQAERFIGVFTHDAEVITVGADYRASSPGTSSRKD